MLAQLLAEADATDASEELRRLQETAAVLRGLQGRLTDAYRLGMARPPRWLLASWHYVAMCSGAQLHSSSRLSARSRASEHNIATPRLRPGHVASKVRALLSRRRGYDKVPLASGGEWRD